MRTRYYQRNKYRLCVRLKYFLSLHSSSLFDNPYRVRFTLPSFYSPSLVIDLDFLRARFYSRRGNCFAEYDGI